MCKRRCACGCNEPCTGAYRVKRGHGGRIPEKDRPGVIRVKQLLAEERRSTHLPDVPKPVPKERACLKCDRSFMSEGPHHRLCPRCHGSLAITEPAPEPKRLPSILHDVGRAG